MNREILFKAKRIDNGEWVEGDLLQCNDGRKFICTSVDLSEEKEGLGQFEIYIRLREVIPETICQYTGLIDKDGNKIWENDFLCDRHTFYKVRWDDKFARFIVDEYTKYNGKYVVIDRRGFNYFKEAPEIVGNKFDNPELLKGGAEE